MQAEVDISNPTGEYALHLKHCSVQSRRQDFNTNEWTIIDNEFDFLVDGCITTVPLAENQFGMTLVTRSPLTISHLENKATRVQWTNSSAKTYLIDQFRVDLWDNSVQNETNYFFECQMVLCEVDGFFQSIAHSICKLPDDRCTSRYSNLKTTHDRLSNGKRDDILRTDVYTTSINMHNSRMVPNSLSGVLFSALLLVVLALFIA